MKNLFIKKNVKIALLLLIGGILAYGAIAIFGGNNEVKPGGIQGVMDLNPSAAAGGSEVNGVVKEAPRRKTYAIGKWDIAIPYLNPFGSQNNYESVKLLPNQYQELRYIDENNMETSRMTSGTAWQMQVEWTDKTVDPFDDLNLYVAELGGAFYRGPAEDKWVMRVDDPEGHRWWGVASKNGGGYLLTAYRELKLRQGETVTFKTADFNNQELYFMTNNEDHKYQSIKATLAEGEMQVLGKGAYEQGQYRRDLQYGKWMYVYKTKEYTLSDIPQDPSVPILWRVTWRSGSDPREISFTLDEGEEISSFRDGEQLGALKVRGNMLGSIQVEMSPGVTMSHPELNLTGDKTPEGDTLFWLPPGYWNVKATQRGGQTGAVDLNTRLIPVSAGEMTELEIKPLLANSYSNDELGDSSGGESLLKMEKIAEQGDRAKIDFMLLDSQSPKYTPTLADIRILEGGRPGKVLKLDRLQIPPSVVLALDSSGSMAKSMDQVLESARTFIQGLPENARIQVIDFDSEARLLPGIGKKEVLESLKQVKAKGNTALYDSIVQGLDLLQEKQRPTMVVFSDGVDSSAEKAGTGSKATKQEVVQAVKASGIPLFMIGFGPDHDSATLLELAGMSEGTYYSAKDAAVLAHVFTSINDRLGNQFELIYERPKEQAPSDVPAISLTLDVSGSMDVDPASGDGNYRIDKMKDLFHDFIGQIPENSLMQLISFSSGISVEQVFTRRKAEILQSLGHLEVGRGTNILDSVSATYRSLKKVPSDKRVMVYLTDAALDVEPYQKEMFEKILSGIKEEGIQVLWVGLGTGESEEAFQWAADKSGGKYVISEDPQVLAQAFQEALAEVKRKPAEKVSLSLSINNGSEQGVSRQYTDSQLVDFPVRLNAQDRVALDTIGYEAGKKIA
ncbi:VWA domain-containing protein [Cohnella cellulosilytica]|uniref:VWA domain-containing protein n=1 Tax=Cohnella cellulosilytica TaxID=986710 RepID=A0ABW2FDB2_9BACL